jgi:uncharacterized membrane protein YqjE
LASCGFNQREEKNDMFWTFILFAGLALVFVKLGAYSVWMAIYSGGLKLAVLLIVSLISWMIFRKVFPTQR